MVSGRAFYLECSRMQPAPGTPTPTPTPGAASEEPLPEEQEGEECRVFSLRVDLSRTREAAQDRIGML